MPSTRPWSRSKCGSSGRQCGSPTRSACPRTRPVHRWSSWATGRDRGSGRWKRSSPGWKRTHAPSRVVGSIWHQVGSWRWRRSAAQSWARRCYFWRNMWLEVSASRQPPPRARLRSCGATSGSHASRRRPRSAHWTWSNSTPAGWTRRASGTLVLSPRPTICSMVARWPAPAAATPLCSCNGAREQAVAWPAGATSHATFCLPSALWATATGQARPPLWSRGMSGFNIPLRGLAARLLPPVALV
mmetsp:Transcript_9365/g.31058  ORF Transcript_9365/g.31058 Transcript_9365/m.31058 type:complete len:244 (+) Transcript_9365:1513-2244(+)